MSPIAATNVLSEALRKPEVLRLMTVPGVSAITAYERVRARRGAQVAAVATARKLANLFWCLLTRLRTTVAGAPQDPLPRARRRRTVTQGPGPSRSRLAQQADP
jgi:hypothetical protein